MIQCIHNHGFAITFDNHWTINVLFGKHNSCSRLDVKERGKQYDDANKQGIVQSITCEVTITDNKGKAVVFGSDTSMKYVNAQTLSELIFKTSIARDPSDITDFDISKIRKEEDWE